MANSKYLTDEESEFCEKLRDCTCTEEDIARIEENLSFRSSAEALRRICPNIFGDIIRRWKLYINFALSLPDSRDILDMTVSETMLRVMSFNEEQKRHYAEFMDQIVSQVELWSTQDLV